MLPLRRIRPAIAAALTALLIPSLVGAQTAPAGFTSLFNERDLSGWQSSGPGWRVDPGVLRHAASGTGRLETTATIGDVELRLDVRTQPGARAALRLRDALHVDLGDTKGEWVAVVLQNVGERVSLSTGGAPSSPRNRVAGPRPMPATGAIGLEVTGDVQFRRLAWRPIPGDEANALLARHEATGFTSLFNGRDFTGWSGPIDNYQVVDGTILCKPGKGGTIYTTATYKDFVVRLEFKLPPAGNNGLAIRYPGDGDAAYAGMTELQVLDNTSEKYLKLDPRQFHGSAYGMAPAAKGYLRPVGEWNFQEVTVRGSTIRVELNGTVILETDLSTITEFLDNRPHPGKDRTEGHFGFAGHGDPVQFRAVSIKPL